MPRSGDEAIAWAKNQSENDYNTWFRYCLKFTRHCFGVEARYPDAKTAWRATKRKHSVKDASKVPAGVPVWWLGGTWGHVALSDGDGWCWSTDFKRKGMVDRVRIDDITRAWGYTFVGWTEDINGVVVAPPPPWKPKRKIDLSRVQKAARLDPDRPQGEGTPGCRIYVQRVERCLKKEGLLDKQYADGAFGTATIAAYAAWQEKLGYRGKDADGIPGHKSLRALARKYGMVVT